MASEKTKKEINEIPPEKCDFCGGPAEVIYDGEVVVCGRHEKAIQIIATQEAIGFLQDLLLDKYVLPKKIAGQFLVKDFEGLRKELCKRHPLYKVKILKGERRA